MRVIKVIIRFSCISMFLLTMFPHSLFAQLTTENFKINDVNIKVDTKEFTNDSQKGCSTVLNSIAATSNGRIFFDESICTPGNKDVLFIQKGYMTIIEHHSSTMGWSQFYLFDYCQRRVVITIRIEGGKKLPWEDFIELSEATKKQFVQRVLSF